MGHPLPPADLTLLRVSICFSPNTTVRLLWCTNINQIKQVSKCVTLHFCSVVQSLFDEEQPLTVGIPSAITHQNTYNLSSYLPH